MSWPLINNLNDGVYLRMDAATAELIFAAIAGSYRLARELTDVYFNSKDPKKDAKDAIARYQDAIVKKLDDLDKLGEEPE